MTTQPPTHSDPLIAVLERIAFALENISAAGEYPKSPEGLPICRKHQAIMRKREKQGDVWYSHKVIDHTGAEHYCRGYADKSSPGWAVELDDDDGEAEHEHDSTPRGSTTPAPASQQLPTTANQQAPAATNTHPLANALAQAEAMLTHDGKRYGDLTTPDLAAHFNGIVKSLKDNHLTPAERTEKEAKKKACELLLASRNRR